MIYVASPYSDRALRIRKLRYRAALRFTAHLARQQLLAYSPVVHGHVIHEALAWTADIPYEYWLEHCAQMLQTCSDLYILQLDGWDRSRGVAYEMALAKSLNKPIKHYDPRTYCYITG